MRLRIGISPSVDPADPMRPIFKDKRLMIVEENMARFVMNAGAVPLLLPLAGPGVIDSIDGLIMSGGSDVAPSRYGEEPIKADRPGDPERDEIEFALFHEAMRQGKPILGICRGHQLLNVALGGTLWQDITVQCPSQIVHRNWDVYEQNVHTIVWENGETAIVNSIHSQAIRKLADGLVVEARARDNVIEAVRLKSNQYVRGVQWHPEFHHMKEGVLDPQPMMDEFFSACKEVSRA